jgi:hypothetical protein
VLKRLDLNRAGKYDDMKTSACHNRMSLNRIEPFFTVDWNLGRDFSLSATYASVM